MAVFKCKMCGGSLTVEENQSTAVCDYCGTAQTLPRLNNDRRINLYDRANHFRRNSEFDKAMGIYEQILNEDPTDAEAYWSRVLCRYGIEYVEDPTTHKRIPTVNRTQFTSIFDDADYQSALQYGDTRQQELYRQEAESINEIQKGILAISQQEEPFDVFLCYKETDAAGRRTPDSVLAQEIYYELVNEGLKVFFSRITLEDKIGAAYEPYIFAALNSAKVMVVLGTKSEYFTAAWVKNEWSRYLSLIKNGAKKVLIPAYRDMDPYNLPEEFSHLQAQDMSKLGFMQDLLRGIQKIVSPETPEEPARGSSVPQAAPLLRRAFLFLEDGDWKRADEYAEQVLNLQPENGEAYLVKLLVERKLHARGDLAQQENDFADSNAYKKAMRFGSEELCCELQEARKQIKERNAEKVYCDTCQALEEIKDDSELYRLAAEQFRSISWYQDAEKKAEECEQNAVNLEKEALYREACRLMPTDTQEEESILISKYRAAAQKFRDLSDWRDAAQRATECEQQAENMQKNMIYESASQAQQKDTIEDLKSAQLSYASLHGWRDSAQQAVACKNRMEQLLEEQKQRMLEEQRYIARETKNMRIRQIFIVLAIVTGVPGLALTSMKNEAGAGLIVLGLFLAIGVLVAKIVSLVKRFIFRRRKNK